jgi:hypothetical protein
MHFPCVVVSSFPVAVLKAKIELENCDKEPAAKQAPQKRKCIGEDNYENNYDNFLESSDDDDDKENDEKLIGGNVSTGIYTTSTLSFHHDLFRDAIWIARMIDEP